MRDLSVSVAGKQIINRLTLTAAEGERLGIVGRSGCGKTTLLRAIAGLIEPREGEVRLQGRLPAECGWPAYRRNVVYVAQRPALLDASILANLQRPFAYGTSSTAFPDDRARALLDQVGLGGADPTETARDLSEGEQQRLCLVRAILPQPPVLLLDEPTSALDADSVGIVESIIETESEVNGLTALIVTHDQTQARRWCHRVVDLS